MAYATMDSVKVNPQTPIKTTFTRMINYRINPKKTNNFEYISTYACTLENAIDEFCEAIENYEMNTLRLQNHSSDHIAYQAIQSFPAGEITPELANSIGYELAQELFGENHMFLVCTHTDRSHIHNHIYACAVNLDEDKKWKEIWHSSFHMQEISNQITSKYGLSTIEKDEWDKYQKGKKYKEWLEETKLPGSSWKGQIKNIINNTMIYSKSYSELCDDLMKQGVKVRNTSSGVSFMLPGQQKWARGKTLGNAFTRENLIKQIAQLNGKTVDEEKQIVNIKKSFIFKENDNFIYTRIPYSEFFIAYSKKDNSVIKDDLGNVSLEINPFKIYEITNRANKAKEQISGAELLQMYSRRKRKSEEEEMQFKKRKIEQSYKVKRFDVIAIRSTAKINYVTYIAYQQRKKAIINTKNDIDSLNYMRSLNVSSYNDIVFSSAALEEKIKQISTQINSLTKEINTSNNLLSLIKDRNKLQPIFDEYNSLKSKKAKEKFKNEHEIELLEFNTINKKIALLNSSHMPAEINQLNALIENNEQKTVELQGELNVTTNKLKLLTNGKNMIDRIIEQQKSSIKTKQHAKSI